MHLHHEYDPARPVADVFAAQQALAKDYTVTPILPDDRLLCGFLHIFAGGCGFSFFFFSAWGLSFSRLYPPCVQTQPATTATSMPRP